MSTEENKKLVTRFYEEIDKGNLDAMDEFVAEHYIDHAPPPFPGFAPGREGLKQAFRLFWEATPGTHKIEDQIAEGDKVATRFTVRMTHRATGVLVTLTAIAIAQLLDGQLVAYWDEADMLGLLRQVGALPAPGPPSERLGWG